MPLTTKQIENAKPKDKSYKLADAGGLCLLVAPFRSATLAVALSLRR